ncbi:hypothetical protein [Ktedonobacter sp. SOSP1-52]|uniref:hypothetical protein n=1 Tax=Ktedonobacter sp. SOSP1-52 TaxID=2778366 RepID=UPI0019160D91|nr:hypothetical protein [Ktedonobacter sp. SOSP1-52]
MAKITHEVREYAIPNRLVKKLIHNLSTYLSTKVEKRHSALIHNAIPMEWSISCEMETLDSKRHSSFGPERNILTYQVSASQKSFTLAFEAGLLSSGQTVWDLSI